MAKNISTSAEDWAMTAPEMPEAVGGMTMSDVIPSCSFRHSIWDSHRAMASPTQNELTYTPQRAQGDTA